MKKILILFIVLIFQPAFAQDYQIVCPANSLSIVQNEKILNKISGINFVAAKTAQIIIQSELNRELNSNFKANLKIFNTKSLKQGEFKELKLKSQKINYKSLALSDFEAQTLCPYNKIIYKKKRIYYPQELPFKFSAKITNENVKSILSSESFQKELSKYNNIKGLKFETPTVEIEKGKLNFSFPVRTFLSKEPFLLRFSSDLKLENNKIVLKNINLISRSNIININMLSYIINCLNPIAFEFNSFKSKYLKINVTEAKITGNIIEANGIFIINRNYDK